MKTIKDFASVADYIAATPKRLANELRADIELLSGKHGAFEHAMLQAARDALGKKKARGKAAPLRDRV